jgi:hypothetical protein
MERYRREMDEHNLKIAKRSCEESGDALRRSQDLHTARSAIEPERASSNMTSLKTAAIAP